MLGLHLARTLAIKKVHVGQDSRRKIIWQLCVTIKSMEIAEKSLIGLLALEHLYFLWLEMFAWRQRGPKVFPKMPPSMFEPSKLLAANQGLYNGFLAAGLIWSLLISDPMWFQNVAIFFTACIAIAGIYGGITVERKILAVQALPAILALALLLIS